MSTLNLPGKQLKPRRQVGGESARFDLIWTLFLELSKLLLSPPTPHILLGDDGQHNSSNKCHRGCVCPLSHLCSCAQSFISASLVITESKKWRQTPKLHRHQRFTSLIIHLASWSPCLVVSAGPRPFGPVVRAVFRRGAGAAPLPEPCPVLPVGRPGGEGCGRPRLRVRAERLGAVVSNFLTLSGGEAGV